MKPRHVPMRTCTGCRQERPKRDMVRIVRTPEGAVVLYRSGKRSGRGAYICPRLECWNKALPTGSLAHVLKAQISAEDLAELHRIAAAYPAAAETTEAAAAQIA